MSNNFDINFFATIFDTATEAWILIDDTGSIQMINPRVTEMFGYKEEELLGRKIEVLMPKDARYEHVGLREEYFEAPKKRPHGIGVEVLGLHKEQYTFPVEIGLNYHRYNDRIYSLAVITDITVRRDKEQKLQKSLVEKEQLKQERIKSELKALKNQVNPHYLFNCLSVLSPLIVQDQGKSQKFTNKLAQTYRYILELRERQTVKVKEELKFIEDYLYLQRVRFEDKFTITIDLTEEYLNKHILPLSIQLLIENAFKHNAIYVTNKLHIKIRVEDEELIIENNIIPKMNFEDNSFGIGLKSIEEGYNYLSDKKPDFIKKHQAFIAKIPFID